MSQAITGWKERESKRMADGTYTALPVALDYPPDHFVHLSVTVTEDDFVAYTPSEAYGAADRQVRLKFGRYLRKTFPALTDAEIQAHVTSLKSAMAVIDKPAALHFADGIETINRIFETKMNACGSTMCSCMHGKFDGDTIRPYHVYADSPDVAVAYVTTGDGDIVSRSVVSVKDKTWVRLYSIATGDNDADCGTLKDLLEEAGYRKGDLIGNRLTKLNTRGVMLPYIDNGGAHVKDSGKYWLVVKDGEGDYAADCTDGTATPSGNRCDVCNEREDDCECSICDCCGSRTINGCEDCSMCQDCDGCIQHGNCDCSHCSECHNVINPCRRYTARCECDRCGECHELVDDCECAKCDECGELAGNCTCEENEEEDDETAPPAPAAETEIRELTPFEAREKLNRIYIYLRDKYGSENVTVEFRLLKTAFEAIAYQEVVA